MDFLGQVLAWYTDPANWTGSNGIPVRLWEHLSLSVASLAVGHAGAPAADAGRGAGGIERHPGRDSRLRRVGCGHDAACRDRWWRDARGVHPRGTRAERRGTGVRGGRDGRAAGGPHRARLCMAPATGRLAWPGRARWRRRTVP